MTLPEQINNIRWPGQPWTSIQAHELMEVESGFHDYPFDLVKAYCDEIAELPEAKFLPGRTSFVADSGTNLRQRAEIWQKMKRKVNHDYDESGF